MTSPVLELIYWTSPVTAGDGDDNGAGSHTRQEIEKDSQSVWALWVTELWGNVSIPFGVSVSLSGSPPPSPGAPSIPRCMGVRAGSVGRCAEVIERWGTSCKCARCWVGGWSGIILGCECLWVRGKEEGDMNVWVWGRLEYFWCIGGLDRKKSTTPPMVSCANLTAEVGTCSPETVSVLAAQTWAVS